MAPPDLPPVSPRLTSVRIANLRKIHRLLIWILIVQLVLLIMQTREFIHG